MDGINVESAPPVSAFSDAIAKILRHSDGPRPRKIKREKPDFPSEIPVEGTGDDGSHTVEKDTANDNASRKKLLKKKRSKKESREPWHVIPQVTERERERKLDKIATRGVVQLFNAVRQQQNAILEQLEEAGPSVRKSDKVLKSVSKGAFFDLLKGPSNACSSAIVSRISAADSSSKRWEVLDDQYMVKSGSTADNRTEESLSDDNNDEMEEVF